MDEFFGLSKYLSDPLILAGFILFAVLAVFKLLLSSGSVPKLSKKAVNNLSNKLLLYGFAVSALIIVLGFSLNFAKLFVDKEQPNPLIPSKQLIPFNAGWILVGFFNENTQDYLEGGYAEVVYRPDISQPAKKTPVIGDILRVKKERNIIIANYQKQGLTHQFTSIIDDSVLEPGEKVKILDDDDYTGIAIPKNTLVVVDSVSIGTRGENGSQAVWVLVHQCHIDIDTCKMAKEKIETSP